MRIMRIFTFALIYQVPRVSTSVKENPSKSVSQAPNFLDPPLLFSVDVLYGLYAINKYENK